MALSLVTGADSGGGCVELHRARPIFGTSPAARGGQPAPGGFRDRRAADSDFGTYRQTQLALIKSRLVLGATLRDPQVAALGTVREKQDPLRWLETQVKVDYSGGPEILRISMKGNDPEELTTLVNSLVNAYLDEIVNKEDEKRRTRLRQLQTLHKEYEDRLTVNRQSLLRLARAAGSNDAHVLAIKQELALKRLHKAQEELLQDQSQITRQEVELAALIAKEKSTEPIAVAESQIEEALNRDPTITFRLEEIRQLELILAEILNVTVRKAADPSYERYASLLARSREELQKRREQLRDIVTEQLRRKSRTEIRSNIVRLQEQLGVQNDHHRVLSDLVEHLGKEPRTLNESSLDLETLRQR